MISYNWFVTLSVNNSCFRLVLNQVQDDEAAIAIVHSRRPNGSIVLKVIQLNEKVRSPGFDSGSVY